MKTMRSITQLRREIVKTIKRPDFMTRGGKYVSVQDLAWHNMYLILFNILDCIRKTTLTDHAVESILDEIEKPSRDLDQMLSGKQLLYAWIYIHGLLLDWKSRAEELEEYESCQNLQKIIDIIYDNNVSAYEE
jgi:hypothetical protein